MSRLIQDFLRWLQKLFPQRTPMQSNRARYLTLIAEVLVVLATLFVLGYAARLLFARFKRSSVSRTRLWMPSCHSCNRLIPA